MAKVGPPPPNGRLVSVTVSNGKKGPHQSGTHLEKEPLRKGPGCNDDVFIVGQMCNYWYLGGCRTERHNVLKLPRVCRVEDGFGEIKWAQY